jgi:hypothetical protein
VRSDSTALAGRATLALLTILGAAVGGARGQEPTDSESVRATRLFESNDPLDIHLSANFDGVAKDRGETKHDHPGVLTYVEPGGDTVSLDVKLHTRGHYRLRICKYPPLKIDFPTDRTPHTVFAHQKSLKLVVQCRGGQGYQNYLLEEYLIYRMYNLLTDLSFRVRLARVTYADSGKQDIPEQRFGFFLEDDDRMARRNHLTVFEQPGVYQEQVNQPEMSLVAVFEYLIGNTDWSVWGLHNIVLVRDSAMVVYPVPYDFDWSGVISTPYARPDSRLNIATVRERLYRGSCTTTANLGPIFANFNAHKDSIYALYRAQSGLEEKRIDQTLKYYDEFYKTINDPRATRVAMQLRCAGT